MVPLDLKVLLEERENVVCKVRLELQDLLENLPKRENLELREFPVNPELRDRLARGVQLDLRVCKDSLARKVRLAHLARRAIVARWV